MAVGRALVGPCSQFMVVDRDLPENVRSIIDLGGPLRLAAMALSVVGGHVCCGLMVIEMGRSIEGD